MEPVCRERQAVVGGHRQQLVEVGRSCVDHALVVEHGDDFVVDGQADERSRDAATFDSGRHQLSDEVGVLIDLGE